MGGVSHAVGRVLAPLSFVVNIFCQVYAVARCPNTLDIHRKYPSAFTPNPWFIVAFFLPQQILQGYWLYRLFQLPRRDDATDEEEQDIDTFIDYVPWYALSNFAIAAWAGFWTAELLYLAFACVALSTFSQFTFLIWRQMPMRTSNDASVLTHLVSKTYAGINVLDFLHAGMVAWYAGEDVSVIDKFIIGVGFAVGSLSGDWILGACLVFDLLALCVGQHGMWRVLLGIYVAVSAILVVAKNFLRPPYHTPFRLDDHENDPLLQ